MGGGAGGGGGTCKKMQYAGLLHWRTLLALVRNPNVVDMDSCLPPSCRRPDGHPGAAYSVAEHKRDVCARASLFHKGMAAFSPARPPPSKSSVVEWLDKELSKKFKFSAATKLVSLSSSADHELRQVAATTAVEGRKGEQVPPLLACGCVAGERESKCGSREDKDTYLSSTSSFSSTAMETFRVPSCSSDQDNTTTTLILGRRDDDDDERRLTCDSESVTTSGARKEVLVEKYPPSPSLPSHEGKEQQFCCKLHSCEMPGATLLTDNSPSTSDISLSQSLTSYQKPAVSPSAIDSTSARSSVDLLDITGREELEATGSGDDVFVSPLLQRAAISGTLPPPPTATTQGQVSSSSTAMATLLLPSSSSGAVDDDDIITKDVSRSNSEDGSISCCCELQHATAGGGGGVGVLPLHSTPVSRSVGGRGDSDGRQSETTVEERKEEKKIQEKKKEGGDELMREEEEEEGVCPIPNPSPVKRKNVSAKVNTIVCVCVHTCTCMCYVLCAFLLRTYLLQP